MPRRFANSLVPFVALLVFSCVPVLAQQDPIDALKGLDFSNCCLQQAQVQKLTPEDLHRIRGIVFGRYVRVFKDGDINAYLEGQSSYKPNPDFNNSMLNNIER